MFQSKDRQVSPLFVVLSTVVCQPPPPARMLALNLNFSLRFGVALVTETTRLSQEVLVHVDAQAAMTGVSRFGQRKKGVVYSKQVCLDRLLSAGRLVLFRFVRNQPLLFLGPCCMLGSGGTSSGEPVQRLLLSRDTKPTLVIRRYYMRSEE